MVFTGDNYKENPMKSTAQHSSDSAVDGNLVFNHKDTIREETARQAAERGHAATDKSVLTLSFSRFMY